MFMTVHAPTYKNHRFPIIIVARAILLNRMIYQYRQGFFNVMATCGGITPFKAKLYFLISTR